MDLWFKIFRQLLQSNISFEKTSTFMNLGYCASLPELIMTNTIQWVSLNNKHLLSHGFEGQKSKIRKLARLCCSLGSVAFWCWLVANAGLPGLASLPPTTWSPPMAFCGFWPLLWLPWNFLSL